MKWLEVKYNLLALFRDKRTDINIRRISFMTLFFFFLYIHYEIS
jgi:hypothetical protein